MKPKLNPLKLLPFSAIWLLIGVGIVRDDQVLITLGVVAIGLIAAVLILRKVRQSGRDKEELRRIWRDGIETPARVVSIGTNGGGLNDNPMIDFELDVTPSGRTPYRVSTRALISKLAIPRIQPGCDVLVRVDPATPDRLVLDAALTPYGY